MSGGMRVVRAVGAVLLVAVVVGGCDMSTSSGGGTPASRPNGRYHLDLRTPPRRSALYLPAGEDTVSFARSGGSTMLDVDITLPGDVDFRNPAISWDASLASGSVAGTLGWDVGVHRVEPTVDAAEQVLLGQAKQVGFDAAAIRAFVQRVKTAPNPIGLDNRVFTTHVGYLTLSADLRVESDEPDVLINYELIWDEPGASPAA